MSNVQPRIYVACLAAYNNGILHGSWIDADQDVNALNEEIKNILVSSPISNAEEWAIHDSEWLNSIGEYPSLEKISETAEFIKEHGELGESLLNNFNGDLDYAKSCVEENYHGEWDTEEDFGYHFAEDTCLLEGVSESVKSYFDYKAFARDLFLDGFFSINVNHRLHVFSQN